MKSKCINVYGYAHLRPIKSRPTRHNLFIIFRWHKTTGGKKKMFYLDKNFIKWVQFLDALTQFHQSWIVSFYDTNRSVDKIEKWRVYQKGSIRNNNVRILMTCFHLIYKFKMWANVVSGIWVINLQNLNLMFIINFFFLPFIFCALKHSIAKIALRYLMHPKQILKENTIKKVHLRLKALRLLQ